MLQHKSSRPGVLGSCLSNGLEFK